MKVNKTIITDARVILNEFNALQPRKFPEHLLKENAKRTGKDEFDPNVYFTALTHLKMIPGYTLDYTYYSDNLMGYPNLYARKKDVTSKKVSSDKKSDEKIAVDKAIIADGSPRSFFELLVFYNFANKFYLKWHANYVNKKMITQKEEIEALIPQLIYLYPVEPGLVEFEAFLKENGIEGKAGRCIPTPQLSDEQIAALHSLDPHPTVELTSDRALVTYYMFGDWDGLIEAKEAYQIVMPHVLLDSQENIIAKHDCGISY